MRSGSLCYQMEMGAMPTSTQGLQGTPRSVAFTVTHVRHLSAIPEHKGELWAAHVEAVRPGHFKKNFNDVLFVECPDVVFLLGIESEDALPKTIQPDAAKKQQDFILFLRMQTHYDLMEQGVFAQFFEGFECGCEIAATTAYCEERKIISNIGAGFFSESEEYQSVIFPSPNASAKR